MTWSSDTSSRIVFIIIPNNNGSSVVYRNITRYKNAVSMRAGIFQEGEKIVGMQFNSQTTPMPVPFLYEPRWAGRNIHDPLPGLGRIWGAKRTEIFQDEKRFKWDKIKEIWLENWKSNPKYTEQAILVEKSPTSPAWAYMLPKHFPCARFIISIRNPYATVEGIRRRVLQNQNTKLNLDTCTKHWIKTAELQQRNIGILPQSIWFAYEDMCEMTTDIEKQIQSLIPELGIFRFTNLQSLNKQSISNLTMEEIRSITRHLEQHEAMMHFFNYELIT